MIRWGAVAVGLSSIIAISLIPNGGATLILVALFLAAFAVVGWTCREPRAPRAVSPAFERAQQLSTLDRRDGVGGRS